MSSRDGLSSSSNPSLTCSPTHHVQEDMSNSTLAFLAATHLPSSSQNDVANVATTALHLERYASELLLWLQHSAGVAPADDALFFFETHHPELLDDLPLLFAWLSLFLAHHEDAFNIKTTDVAARAVQQLRTSENLVAIAEGLHLKSELTLLYWRHESDRQPLNDRRIDESDAAETGSSRSQAAFQDDKALLRWIFRHRDMQLTKQDIIDYLVEKYPDFAAAKTTAALKVWTSRFLKKHIPPQSLLAATPPVDALPQMLDADAETFEHTAMLSPAEKATPSRSECADDKVETLATQDATLLTKKHTGKRRSCTGRYMLFSNEFKLHAVTMLEEGKSVAQVTEELGLKNSNCLHYWKSIREKLVTSEKKRFRLAGGGRRSSCSFEDELLTWVSERHQQGQGTDVKAVLEYMKRSHSYFTDGKKEPTLRKWILRFFKRCWRAPSTSIDSQDAEKSYIFV